MNRAFGFIAAPLAALALGIAAASCSGRTGPALPRPGPADRALHQRAFQRACTDSAGVVRQGFSIPATMRLDMRQGDATIEMLDSFLLQKQADSALITTLPLAHSVAGDTSLLQDMYTFQTSKGQTRVQSQSQLAGLHFGADVLFILRQLQADTANTAYVFTDTVVADTVSATHSPANSAQILRRPAVQMQFTTPDQSGLFVFDKGTMELITSQTNRESSYIVGSYAYHLHTRYRDGLPLRTASDFTYRRLFTGGSGRLSVELHSERIGLRQ